MKHFAAMLLTVLVMVGSVSAYPAATGSASVSDVGPSAALQTEANATNMTPGQRLAGVIGANQAEFEGTIELRAYGFAYANARSNASKARVVGERLESVQQRLRELEQRRASLEQARANGTISEGEYRARLTALTARSNQLRAMLKASETRAAQLPNSVLAANGINMTAITTLRERADNLTGREAAEIAREIAGPSVGESVDRGPPAGDNGPPSDVPADQGPPNNSSETETAPAVEQPDHATSG
ncbi:MAG: hypothetical protein ABEH59_07785 [Halobacteriales archaeon]